MQVILIIEMPGQLTYDQIYNGVAANKQGLTKDQFNEDMSNPQNSLKLYTNLKQGNAGVPSDYKGFVDLLKQGQEQAKPKEQQSQETQDFYSGLEAGKASKALKTFSNVVNSQSPQTGEQQAKQSAEDKKMEDIVTSAYTHPKNSLMTNQPTFNEDGTVSYYDEKGNYKILSTTEVSSILRKKQEQTDIDRRANGTPVEKAQYAVADYLGGILPDFVKGTKEYAHSVVNSIKNPADWKNNMLEGLTGAVGATTSVLKVIPATATGLATFSAFTGAADAALTPYKDKNEGAYFTYHTIKLLTQPATEARSWFTSDPMSKQEAETYALADNLSFLLGAHLVSKGITSMKDIPISNPTEKLKAEDQSAQPATEHPTETTNPATTETKTKPMTFEEKVAENQKNARALEIKDKLAQRKPIELSDMPIVAEAVQGSSHQDIKDASKATAEKQDLEKQAIENAQKEKEKQNSPEALDEKYVNLTKGEVKEYQAKNLSEPVIQKLNDEVGKKKVEEELNKKFATSSEDIESQVKEPVKKKVDDIKTDLPFDDKEKEEATQERMKESIVKPVEEAKNNIEEPEEDDKIKNINKEGAQIGLDRPVRSDYDEGESGDRKYMDDVIEHRKKAQDFILNNIKENGTLIDPDGNRYTVKVGLDGNIKTIEPEGDVNGIYIFKNGKFGRNQTPYINGIKFEPENSLGITPEGIQAAEESTKKTQELLNKPESALSTNKDIANLQERINDIKESDLSPEEKESSIQKLQDKIDKAIQKETGEPPLSDIDIVQHSLAPKFPQRWKDIMSAKAKGILDKKYFKPIFEGVDVSKLTKSKADLAKSEMDVRGVVNKAVTEANGDPQKFRDTLYSYALVGLDNNTPIDDYTAAKLANMADLIVDKQSMKTVYKFMLDRPRYKFGDTDITPQTIEEYKNMEKLDKLPSRPISYKEKTTLKKAFDPEQKMDYAGLFPDEPTGLGTALKMANNILRPQAYYMNNLPESIRDDYYGLWRGYMERVNKGRAYDMSNMHSEMHPDVFKDYTNQDFDKTISAIYKGHFTDRKYYSDEELEKQGLNNKQKGLYNTLIDQVDNYKKDQLAADKANLGYDKMSNEAKEKFDDTHRTYLTKENGYFPFYRYGDYYVLSHGEDAMEGGQKTHLAMFQTEKEAQEYKKNLPKDHVGVDASGERDEEREPIIRKRQNLSADELEAVKNGGGTAVIDQLLADGVFKEGSEPFNKLQDYKKSLQAQIYNPHHLESNRIAGVKVDKNTVMHSLENMRARGINEKSNSEALNFYNDGADKIFQGAMKQYRKQSDEAIKDNQVNMASNKYVKGLYTAAYFQNLAAKPSFMAQMLLHTVNTTYPEIGIRLDELIKQGKAPKTATAETIYGGAWGHATKGWTQYLKGDHTYDTKNFDGLTDKTLQRMKMSGTIGNPYYDQTWGLDREPKGDKSADRVFGKVMGWSTGQLDPLTRYHAGVAGAKLAGYEGLDKGKDSKGNTVSYEDLKKDPEGNKDEIKRIEDEHYKYVNEFVDKVKFLYGKYNYSQLQRLGAKYEDGRKTALDLVSKNILSFANTHVNALYLMGDQLRRASDVGGATLAKTAARIAVPRLAAGGLNALPYVWALTAVEGIIAHSTGTNPAPVDTEVRKRMIDKYGMKDGNKYTDMIMHGLGANWGLDLKPMIAIGELYNENMSAGEKFLGVGGATVGSDFEAGMDFAHGNWNKGFSDLPGESHNLAQAFQWNKLYENKQDYQKTGKVIGEMAEPRANNRFYSPNPEQIGARAMGFPTLQQTMYNQEEDIKKEFIGSGQEGGYAQGGRKKDIYTDLTNTIKNATPEQQKAILRYAYAPTETNFVNAFGKDMDDKLTKYNQDLTSQLKQTMDAEHYSMPDAKKTLKEFMQYGISYTNKDLVWEYNRREGTQVQRIIKNNLKTRTEEGK